MIKQMRSENINIGRVTDTEVVLTISGLDHRMTVDEFREMIKVSELFWDANSLYNFTKEAIEEREEWAKRPEYEGQVIQGGVPTRLGR